MLAAAFHVAGLVFRIACLEFRLARAEYHDAPDFSLYISESLSDYFRE